MGLAWMVTALMVASTPFRGRWFFGLTGIRSSSSKVSQPSITFPNTVYLGQRREEWLKVSSKFQVCSLEIQGWLWSVCEKPLAPVGVWSRVGHRENSPCFVFQVILDLILVLQILFKRGNSSMIWSGWYGGITRPEIFLPKCSLLPFLYLLGLLSEPWNPEKILFGKTNLNYQNVLWCSLWTCNCCSNPSHTRPRNFHMSGGKIQN